MRKLLLSVLFTAGLGLLQAQSSVIRYVKAGGSGTGQSWLSPSGDLQEMINLSSPKDQIWVAAGTYKPIRIAESLGEISFNNRRNSFVLKKDVKIYGGFAGGELTLAERNLKLTANASILSGDLGTPGVNSDNSYHVVISADEVGTAELNGFKICDGSATPIGGGAVSINGKTIYKVHGGGIYNIGSSPILTDLIICGNEAMNAGGGIYNRPNATPVVTNVVVSGNKAPQGAGISIEDGTTAMVLTNVTVGGNLGVGISNISSIIQLRNSVVYGNSNGITNAGTGSTVITNSLVQDQAASGSNIAGSTDPGFVLLPTVPGLTTDGDYHLKASSPVINFGGNTYFDVGQTPDLHAVTTDLEGNDRIQKGVTDIGAYESPYDIAMRPDAEGILYVTQTGGGDHSGHDWANASSNLQAAIDADGVRQVWVAGGFYIPLSRAGGSSSDRNRAFVLKKDVSVFGSFQQGVTDLSNRNAAMMAANVSVLSGELGDPGPDDNASHVVIIAGDIGTGELNGFQITGGNADGMSDEIIVNGETISNYLGGGIYNLFSSPTLTNLTVSGNAAQIGGGILIQSHRSDVVYSQPLISNVIISGNTASQYGGGMANMNLELTSLTNAVISGNTALLGGGGIYNLIATVYMTNVTMSGNNSPEGGAVYNQQYATSILRNCIVYGNSSGVSADNGPTNYYNSLVQEMADIGQGNIDGVVNAPIFENSPDFRTAPFTGGDYQLKESSPGINSGDNTFYAINKIPDLHLITTDLAGNPRIELGNVDLGAYERIYGPALIPDLNKIIYVTDSGRGDFTGSSWANSTKDLQAAINTDGVEQVWVAGGTYHPIRRADLLEIIKPGDRNNAFVLKKDVKIYGSFAGMEDNLSERTKAVMTDHVSILSGEIGDSTSTDDNAYHIIISAGNVGTASLDGFIIRDSYVAGAEATITVNTLDIFQGAGGGIHNFQSSPTLNNLTITGNNSTWGAGIYNADHAAPIISNSVISNNTSFDNNSHGRGGGMYNTNYSSPVMSHLLITGNFAGLRGGGIYNEGFSSPLITDVIISNNKTIGDDGGGGGGIYNTDASSPIITHSSIIGNQTATSGGGMYNTGELTNPIITNVIISGNLAEGSGGGMLNAQASPTLTNVTISGNIVSSVSSIGGAMIHYSLHPLNIRNSIIYGNISKGTYAGIYDNYGSAVIKYSLVQEMPVDLLNHNLDGLTDPSFVAEHLSPVEAFTDGDYRLDNNSLAINKGNNAYFDDISFPRLDTVTIDLAGNPRFDGAAVDLGAYEFQGAALPVSLLNYRADAEGGRIRIEWSTVSEMSNKEFIVSRSIDGKTFMTLAKVAGAGNSSVQKDYTYYDKHPIYGKNYYRLMQVGLDGRVTEHGIRAIDFSASGGTLKLYPNPAKDYLFVEALNAGNIRIFNVGGSLIKTDIVKKGLNKLNVSRLSPGIYFCTVDGIHLKFIKN
ncbi:MAG TPA: choice-of-anchor Q domain-containing protein [Arachidicoccus sp.]|nr:choice-of-anchor Q domain-containing protein [Arachidicoccus sp.]